MRLTEDEQNVVHLTVLQRVLEWVLLIGTGIAIVCLIRRIANGPTKTLAERLRSWLSASAEISDELWEYDTGGNSWENLHGECGYAIVRGGRAIQFWMCQMN